MYTDKIGVYCNCCNATGSNSLVGETDVVSPVETLLVRAVISMYHAPMLLEHRGGKMLTCERRGCGESCTTEAAFELGPRDGGGVGRGHRQGGLC